MNPSAFTVTPAIKEYAVGIPARVTVFVAARTVLQHEGVLADAAVPQPDCAKFQIVGLDPFSPASWASEASHAKHSTVKALLERYAAGKQRPQSCAEALGAAGLVYGC